MIFGRSYSVDEFDSFISSPLHCIQSWKSKSAPVTDVVGWAGQQLAEEQGAPGRQDEVQAAGHQQGRHGRQGGGVCDDSWHGSAYDSKTFQRLSDYMDVLKAVKD